VIATLWASGSEIPGQTQAGDHTGGMELHRIILRIKVILRSVVVRLAFVAFVISALLPTAVDALGVDHPAVIFTGQAVATLGVAIVALRRVTEVLEQARGILPPDGDVAWTNRELQEAALRLHPAGASLRHEWTTTPDIGVPVSADPRRPGLRRPVADPRRQSSPASHSDNADS